MTAERERAAATETVRQALPYEDAGQVQVAGLCEACGYRRQTEALIEQACLLATAFSVGLEGAADVAAAREEFLRMMDPADLAADPAAAQTALAFGALQTVQQVAPRRRALAMLGCTGEAEDEARWGYATEQGRRWFSANPTGTDAVAAATNAAEAAPARTAEHLLTAWVEQLREQAADRVEEAVLHRGGG
ncbi:hypothetical protein [Streptomyces sp. NPDC008001]|uniref:hypothetical protein n=1 Tax=Streptomyces sp. NPDC008001 TaxID=3364804 RepID=UPI0036E8ECBD